MLHRSQRTADKFAEEYDRHGDSYTDNASIASLREVFNKVQVQVSGHVILMYNERDKVVILNKTDYTRFLEEASIDDETIYSLQYRPIQVLRTTLPPALGNRTTLLKQQQQQ